MKLKMIDEKRVYDELLRLKYKVRKKIEEECGKNSRRCRNQIKKLRKEAGSRKREVMQKNEAKMKHLRKKFREDQEEELNKIPTVMENMKLENLTIFNKKKFDEVKTWDYEVEIIGELVLSNNEKKILRLPPKFAIEENLPEGGLALDEELAYGKARMTINREEEEKLDEEDEGIEEDEEERIETEKDEARTRQIYNPIERKFDDQKRRVTDLSECGRVTLPKPMSTKNEALMG